MDSQEVIRLIRNLPTMCEFTDAYGEPIDSDVYYEAVDMAISALQAQELSETQKGLDTISLQQTCNKLATDTISRQAAIDALSDMHCKSDEDGYVWIIRSDAWARIDALPSVTPKQKTGKWIDITKTGGDFVWKCSECGELNLEDTYFCPNCGARMEENV